MLTYHQLVMTSSLLSAAPTPLYYQLQLDLRRLIEGGRLRPGDAVPSESELQRRYRVSRITVRRALAELEREGLVEARQGVGTFVADPERTNANCLTSFTIAALRRGRTPGTKLLEFRTVRGVQPARDVLRLGADEPMVFLKRLRYLDGDPIYISSAFLPERLVPEFTLQSFPGDGAEQSLYYVLEQRFGIPLGEGEEETAAEVATDEVAEIFGLEPHSPVIRKTCLLSRRDGVPLVYEEAVWGLSQSSRVIWRRPLPVDPLS